MISIEGQYLRCGNKYKLISEGGNEPDRHFRDLGKHLFIIHNPEEAPQMVALANLALASVGKYKDTGGIIASSVNHCTVFIPMDSSRPHDAEVVVSFIMRDARFYVLNIYGFINRWKLSDDIVIETSKLELGESPALLNLERDISKLIDEMSGLLQQGG